MTGSAASLTVLWLVSMLERMMGTSSVWFAGQCAEDVSMLNSSLTVSHTMLSICQDRQDQLTHTCTESAFATSFRCLNGILVHRAGKRGRQESELVGAMTKRRRSSGMVDGPFLRSSRDGLPNMSSLTPAGEICICESAATGSAVLAHLPVPWSGMQCRCHS